MLKFKSNIENLFKNSSKFSDDEGNLYLSEIFQSIEKIDKELVKLLLQDTKAKEKFFVEVEGVYVLEQNKLIEFFMQKDYMKNNSFTAYTNKIGLIKKDSFIKKFDDVVLAWPHKDCILEGGQTKDEQKKQETFYNEILSADECDRLFEPKVLTNIKRYTKDGVEKNPTIKDDDNLIIKGNNLIALHSLKKKFAGKVKLIYIDPPYNTGNDSFKYNDNFNHSTWLTFMKNRLEEAQKFLSDDGVIFVQIDDNEQAYLKILMDEVFKQDNFIQTIAVKRATTAGFKSINLCPITTKEYILIYSNNKEKRLNPIYVEVKRIDNYDYFIENFEDGYEKWTFISLNDIFLKNHNLLNWQEAKKKFGNNWKLFREIEMRNFALKNNEKVISFRDVHKPSDKIKELMSLSKQNPDKVFVYERKNKNNMYFNKGRSITFLKNKLKQIDGKLKPSEILTDFWDDISWDGIAKEGLIQLKNAKKPEKLLKRIIELSTQPNDLVMDFHLGSGTTCAVAHKMGRRYIGIEQMDYIEDIAVERLKKVIDGEQGGISKAVEWNGGGSFVYAELKTIDTFKGIEVGALNKNMQYLPISEIEDKTYNISDEEIAINKSFYGVDDE